MAAKTAGIPDPDESKGLGKLDKRITDALGKLSASDLVILRWHLRRRDEQTCPDPVPTVWWLLGGRGCVAAGTPIWDPVSLYYRPIESMTEPGWVLSTEGPVIASPSYIKGVAQLFRLETERGDVVLATAEHRFLTKRGYVELQEIGPDDELVSFDPLKWLPGGQRSKEKALDLKVGCGQQLHLCDQRLRQAQGVVQGTLPSLAGAVRLDTSQPQRPGECASESPYWAFMAPPPLHGRSDGLSPDKVMEHTTGERVRSVVAAGTQEFYDLHVPGPNNYLAAGMFHHNSGKTYSASNHIYEYTATLPFTPENETVYVALIGSVFDDVKNTMVEGQSGLLKLIPEEDILKWNRTVGELSWRVVGPEGKQRVVRCNAYTSEKPDKLRGPNIHVAWIDEYAKFKDADIDPTKAGTTWQNMMLGLRLGTKPHVIVTGTPTDCRLSKYLLAHPAMKMSLMTTIDNRDNLPESFYDEIMLMDPTSRTYRQEVLAELIFDNPDAIFTTENIERGRADIPEDTEIVYKVLGYDPSVSSAADADECGLVLSAYTPEVKEKSGDQGGRPRIVTPTHAYVLKDLSGHYTPHEQTQLVVQTMLNEAVDDLIFEQNQGVEFVMTALEQALKDNVLEYKIRRQSKAKKTDFGIVKRWVVSGVKIDGMPFKFMIYAVHATSQKKLRAEMVSTRYDSGQIHHPTKDNPLATCEVANCRANLESQMTSWDPKSSRYSPDRLDAMAYCMLHIFANFMITRSKVTIARPVAVTQGESQHQAVRPRRKGLVGLYSMDFEPGPLADTAERALIPGLERRYDPNPYI